jgi:hypothetical protein
MKILSYGHLSVQSRAGDRPSQPKEEKVNLSIEKHVRFRARKTAVFQTS